MNIEWHEEDEIRSGSDHGVEISKDGKQEELILAFVHGFAWRKGGDVRVSIQPESESFSGTKRMGLMLLITTKLQDMSLTHGRLTEDFYAHFNA
jgi:hypothetical protein